ncbi:UvrD-helicase domain-containing protein [Candidatus Sumerlaeota bacterium]|nr:UvrD-helicase domain-containing protein [Candidatus Sumerlaeota bacterium]
MRKFTPAQQLSIDTVDRNLLVSAGAGAGKTATLVERIFCLLTIRPHRCSLDELLVVTFSRAAALEMRTRLVERIQHALLETRDDSSMRDHLVSQLTILPRAAISTIHSFCLSVITSHPDKAGLAPGFDLMSEQEERLFRSDFLRNKIEEALASQQENKAFRNLIAQFNPLDGVGRLLDHVIAFHSFLSSLPNPGKFCDDAMRLAAPGEDGGPSAAAMKLIEGHLLQQFEKLERLLARALRHDASKLHPSLQKQHAHIRELHQCVRDAIAGGNPCSCLDEVIAAMPFPNQSPVRNGTEADEKFKAIRKSLMDECGSICETLQAFSAGQLKLDFPSTQETLKFFVTELGMQWFRDLFEAHKQERRLTFAHLERLALQVLVDDNGEATPVAQAYRREFRHVLVDEFQDVNEMQNLILRSVSRPSDDARGGNLFAVGDVKQSIYEFRQADPSLFLARYEQSKVMERGLPPGIDARINLRENFRSHPLLLKELNTIFRQLFTKASVGLDYDDEQAFVAGRTDVPRARAPQFTVEIVPKSPAMNGAPWEDDISAEAVRVAEMIESIGPPWKDVCILLRSTVGTAGELMEALRRRNIPCYSSARTGFLTAVEVIELQSILKAINNPFDEVPLLGALRGPAARWNEEELLLLRAVDRSAFFIDNLERVAGDAAHDLSAKAGRFLDDLARWQKLSVRMPMEELFAVILDDLHLLDQAGVRPGGDQRRLNLLQMLEHARQFDSFARKGLGEFLKFLDDLIANDEDFSPPSPLAPLADVVRIMSIHKSKGMQFPIVIYPFTGRGFNDMNLRQPFLHDRRMGTVTKLRDDGSKPEQHPALFKVLHSIRRGHERAEELRLLYVAMTRAEEALHIVGSADDPMRLVNESCALVEEGALDISAAGRPLDWIVPIAVQRFKLRGSSANQVSIRDGIASFMASTGFTLGSSTSASGTGHAAVNPAPYVEAWARIQELEKKEVKGTLRAKISVSEAKRAFDATRDAQTPAFHPRRVARERDTIEWFPLRESGLPKAHAGLSRGKATHRFLATCDLVGLALGRSRLMDEMSRLIDEGFLVSEDHDSINLQEIAWFLNSELGRRLMTTVGRNWREKPFTCRVDAAELNAPIQAGFVILQGVMDLIFKEEKGWVLIDYKTDFCGTNGERLDALRESYTPQLQLYRILMERTLKEPVAETWIVFLQARQMFVVPAESLKGIAWTDVVESGAVVFPEVTGKATKMRGV